MSSKVGKVYLVGAGPGALELITVRGLQLILNADVIFYDNLVNPQILNFSSSKTERIYVGKRGEGKSSEQKEIEDQIVSAAKKGKIVVRLKGGDPFIFGRGGEEAERLVEEKIPYEIIPGISSAIAVPSYAGIPLTHRDFASTVVFLTGHAKELGNESYEREIQNLSNSQLPMTKKDHQRASSKESIHWSALAKMETIVFLMSVKTIRQNMEQFIKAGRNPQEPCALIRWGTYPKQKTWVSTIEKIASIVEKENIMPPAILVVGKLVNLRKKINWFETKPLFGKKIVVTRALNSAAPPSSIKNEFLSSFFPILFDCKQESLADQLAKLGADILQIPTIEIHPPPSFKTLDAAIQKIQKYQWIIFTSMHGIHFFFDRFKTLKKDFRSLAKCKIAVVGAMSAKTLEKYGFKADLIPKKFNSNYLGKSFSKLNLANKRILIPHAKKGKKDWIEILKSKKAKVEIVEAYQSLFPTSSFDKQIESLRRSAIDLITFTSSSTVINFYHLLVSQNQPCELSDHQYRRNLAVSGKGFKSLLPESEKILEIPCLCIGSTTAKTAKELGFKKIILPAQATLKEMIKKTIDYFKRLD